MKVLKINNDQFSFFQSWNELTEKQALKVASLVQKVDFSQFSVLLFMEVFGLKVLKKEAEIINGLPCYYFKHGRNKKKLIGVEDVNFISKHFEVLFTTEEDPKTGIKKYNINSKLTKNLLKSFRLGFIRYYGPADAITNLKFSEYIHTETNYFNYYKHGTIEYLDKLISTIYRPKKKFHFIKHRLKNYDGDKRQVFNDFFIKQRSKKIARLSMDKKLLILWFYEGCRKFLKAQFPNLHAGGSSEEEGDTFGQFLKLINSLSGSDVTKNKQVREAYLYEVLVQMEQNAIAYKKHKEKIQEQKNKK